MASYNLNLFIKPCIKEITTMDTILHGPEELVLANFHFEVKDFNSFITQLLYTFTNTDNSEKILYTRIYEKATKTFKKWGKWTNNELDFLKVIGNTEIGNSLLVGGSGEIKEDLKVHKNLKVDKELSVISNIYCGNKINSNFILANQLSAKANITTSQLLTDVLNADSITTKNFTTENFSSSGTITFKVIQGDSLTLNKTLKVFGDTLFKQNLNLDKNFIVSGNSTLNAIDAKKLIVNGYTVISTLEDIK